MLRNQESGWNRRTVLAAALFTVGVVFVNDLPAAAWQVQPFVECVKVERRSGLVTIAYVGYHNPGSQPVTLPAGTADNFMLPTPPDRGQPSVFEPGEHHFVFAVVIPAHSQLLWSVNGNRAVASDAMPCPSYLVFKGDWEAGTAYLDGDVVKFNGYYYQAIATTVQGTLLPVVDFAGTPQDSGAPWHVVNPNTYPVMNLPPAAAPGPPPGASVVLSADTFTFPRNGRLTINDARITAESVVQVEYVGGNLLPGVVVDIAAGRFTAIGLPGKKFRYVLIN
jgi:hypothetical protein